VWTRTRACTRSCSAASSIAPTCCVLAPCSPQAFLHAIRFLEKHWPRLCRDIRTGTLDPKITDRAVRDAVGRVLRGADLALAGEIEAECAGSSWEGINRRLWPRTKCIDVIVTGAMSQTRSTSRRWSSTAAGCL